MEKVTISIELANQILGYLGKRPFEEVYSIIERFQKEHKENLSLPAVETDNDDDGST